MEKIIFIDERLKLAFIAKMNKKSSTYKIR